MIPPAETEKELEQEAEAVAPHVSLPDSPPRVGEHPTGDGVSVLIKTGSACQDDEPVSWNLHPLVIEHEPEAPVETGSEPMSTMVTAQMPSVLGVTAGVVAPIPNCTGTPSSGMPLGANLGLVRDPNGIAPNECWIEPLTYQSIADHSRLQRKTPEDWTT